MIILLIGLNLSKAAYPLIATLLQNEHDRSGYTLIYLTGDLLFGIVLVLQHRMHVLTTISIVALGIFYPAFAALIYLVTLISPTHEQ